jgi:hypothetical protein
LSTLAPGEEARPTASLQRLADSPLGEEVRRAIGLASSAATPGDQKHVQRLEKRKWTMPAQTAEGTRVKVRWAWPGLGEAIVAALVAAIAYAAFVRWSPFAGTIAEHRLDAYALEWIAPTSPGQPGSLIGSRAASETDGSIPPNPDIYRDNTRVGAVTGLATPTSRSVSTIDVDQTGAYYQLRATLPSGNLAVSNAVWVPTARAETTPPPKNPDLPVAVTVDLQPWARVRIVAQAGAAGKYQALPTTPLVTPFTIPLLPGDYVMECENGGLTPPLSLQVSVAVGQNQFISRAMPGFDPRRVVDALLGQAAK